MPLARVPHRARGGVEHRRGVYVPLLYVRIPLLYVHVALLCVRITGKWGSTGEGERGEEEGGEGCKCGELHRQCKGEGETGRSLVSVWCLGEVVSEEEG